MERKWATTQHQKTTAGAERLVVRWADDYILDLILDLILDPPVEQQWRQQRLQITELGHHLILVPLAQLLLGDQSRGEPADAIDLEAQLG